MNQIFEFIAGIGLFLFAMKQLETSLRQFAGRRLQKLISRNTDTRLNAILTGTFTTAFLQSSSLVGLVVLALCGAGLMPLYNAIGVMLGANLGTTFTGWIVTLVGFKLNLGGFSLLIVGISGFINVLVPNRKVTNVSAIFISVGLLLFGLDLMKNSAGGIAEHIDIHEFKTYPTLHFLALGIFLSAIIQSSSAVMIITLSALNIQVIELHQAAALIIGADLGTTSTVILGSVKGARIKRQLAFAHFFYNVITNIVAFIVLLPLLDEIIALFGITDPLYSLVLFHSLFNLFGIVIFSPWLKTFSKQIEIRFKAELPKYTQYIDKVPGEIPTVALQALDKEVKSLISKTLIANQNLLNQDDDEQLENYQRLKHVEGDLIRYTKTLQQQNLNEKESETLIRLARATRYSIFSLKSLKDIRDDIQNIYLINKEHKDLELTTEFFQLFQSTAQSLKKLIDNSPHKLRETDWKETLENLRVDLKLHYTRNQDKLYSPKPEQPLTSLEISSLLNLNREIYTSSQSALQAVESYLLR